MALLLSLIDELTAAVRFEQYTIGARNGMAQVRKEDIGQ